MDTEQKKNSYFEVLTDLFSNNSANRVEDNENLIVEALFGEKSEELKNEFYNGLQSDTIYNDLYNLFLESRKRIEKVIKDKPDESKQVQALLLLISEKSVSTYSDERKIIYNIIRKTYYEKWSQHIKDDFNYYYDLLSKEYDCFFSYSRREPLKTNTKCKNIFYDDLDKYNNYRDKNIVADEIVEILRKNHLSVYYDEDDMRSGDKIKEEIDKHCPSAFTFVQLVGQNSFWYRVDERNWCLYEYNTFKIKNEFSKYKRIFFISTDNEERIKRKIKTSPGELKFWITDVLITKFIDLSDEKLDEQLFEDEIINLAIEIIESRQNIIYELIQYSTFDKKALSNGKK